ECRREEADDTGTRRELVDPWPTLGDTAGAFKPKRRAGKAVFQNVVRQQPQHPHDVTEIEAGGLDGNLDFTFARRGSRRGCPAQSVRNIRLPLQPRDWYDRTIRTGQEGMNARRLNDSPLDLDIGFRALRG